jgi:hypothetical protein
MASVDQPQQHHAPCRNLIRERDRRTAADRRGATTLVELLITIGIVALLAGLLLAGVQAARGTVDHVAHGNWLRQRRLDEPPPRTTLRILFIGNSHTFVNDIPGLVTALGAKIGCRVTAQSVAAGGQTLEGHWNGPEARGLIESGWPGTADWDAVCADGRKTPLQGDARRFGEPPPDGKVHGNRVVSRPRLTTGAGFHPQILLQTLSSRGRCGRS